MKKMKLGFGIMAGLLAAAAVTPAMAFEAKLSGQLDQMVMFADDGDKSDVLIGDNSNSSTRIRFKGEEAFGKVKAGVYMEFDATQNASNAMTIKPTGTSGSTADDGDFKFDSRWLEAYFDTDFGKFQFGKGDGAANNVSEQDLSGTDVITKSELNATAKSFYWKNSNGTIFRDNLATTDKNEGKTIGNTTDNFDGLSRLERVRYNTPVWNGFMLAGSQDNGGAKEAALFYAANVCGKLAAAIGYADADDYKVASGAASYQNLGMSASWLAPCGFNLTAGYGQRYFDKKNTEDATNYYGKVGYKKGIHAVSVEYGKTLDLDKKDDEVSVVGLGYVMNPWKPVEFFAGYRVFSLETKEGDSEKNPEDFQQVMAGTRIKF